MRRVLLPLLFISFAATALAQSVVPERQLRTFPNTDFPGGDIQSIFDTTYDICRAQCVADSKCGGFTFNQKSNSCFLKSDLGQGTPFDGAYSVEVLDTPDRVIQLGNTRMADLTFLQPWDIEPATSAALTIAERYSAGDWTLDDLISSGTTEATNKNWEGAIVYFGSALTLEDRSDLWAEFARVSLGYLDTGAYSAVNSQDAQNAAVNAYLRAANPGAQINALLVLSQALEKNSRGIDAIKALRLAETIQPRDDVTAALDRMIDLYGFGVREHQVDSDLTSPRVCANFSEELIAAASEYQSYVRLEGADPVLTVSGSQLCVEGLQHGVRYQVVFREGLPSASGETMQKDVEISAYVRDRAPQVSFPGRGYVLPAMGKVALPIIGVNAPEVDLSLSRLSDRNLIRAIQNSYFGQPMDYYSAEYVNNEMAVQVWTGTGVLKTEQNQDVTTLLPLGDEVGALEPGIYVLQASVRGKDPYEFPPATQWFVVSDLGLATMSGTDGLHVMVRSLQTADIKAGIKVDLISQANEVLASATTDNLGHVLFDAALTRGTGGAAPAVVMAAVGESDFSFLPLTDPEFDLSDRGVEGRSPAGPVDVFLTTDRGAYRAGETIYLTALARDPAVKSLAGVPLTAVLYRPDGQEYSRQLTGGDKEGGHVFAMPVGGSAPRGSWRIDVYSDPDAEALSSAYFLVEDFTPQRIDFALSLPEGMLSMEESPELTIDARYLFGAPGSGFAIEGEAALRPMRSIDAFPGYSFGRYDDDFTTAYQVFDEGYTTDEAGQAVLYPVWPALEKITTPLQVSYHVRLSESSGRPVERIISADVAGIDPIIGIKSDADGVVGENSEAGFSLIALDSARKPTAMKVHWVVNRIETRYQWYSAYGSWSWDPVTTRKQVAEGDAELGAEPVHVAARVDWGRYEIKVERSDGAGAAASQDFYAGWYVSADTVSTPDTLELSLDKTSFKSGDTAKLRIVPRYAGKALITVMSDHVIAMRIFDVKQGENIIEVPVTDDWGPGAYVTASVIRPMDTASGQNPARSLGLSYASVDPGAAQLTATVEMAAESAPRSPLQVAVKVDGVSPGETAYVTLAAVDLGILNLTGFESPDPSDYYFGQRRLGVGLRDVYGRLIDGISGETGALKSGGDGASPVEENAEPPTEELVAYFQGPLEVGADGYVRTSFDMPTFNGTVRVMAVAWSKTGVGQASADVIVRDPVVVTAALPLFLAPQDQSRLLLDFIHSAGPGGDMKLSVSSTGGLTLGQVPAMINLAAGQKTSVEIPVTAGETGRYQITVTLTTPDGKDLTKTLNLGVRDLEPPLARTSRFEVAAGDSFTLDSAVFSGLKPGSAKATLALGPLGRIDAPGLLQALDQYPYGCTEQITSRAMPLLYLDDVAVAMGLEQADQINKRVNEAISEILANQSSSGAFGLWYPDSGDLWLDAYVTDFLSRAKAQGYEVPQVAFRSALDNLRNQINYSTDFESGGEAIAYALLVLAREGAAAIGDLRYYADEKGEAFSTPLAVAQIGAALAAYGDQTRADRMFKKAAAWIKGQEQVETGRYWRSDYGTNLRDAAAVLTLAVESGSTAVDQDALTARISGPTRVDLMSTQESVWSLMAANALIQNAATEDVSLDGAPITGPLVRVLDEDTLGSAKLLKNNGTKPLTVTLTAFGLPTDPEPASGQGYQISRKWYTMEGKEVDVSDVKTGQRLVAVLTVKPLTAEQARLMVNDPLPAGFEIDNPNLMQAGSIAALDWLNLSAYPRSSEFREDRFLAAVDWSGTDSFQLAYIVRAVSPGTFHLPAASVEDMYRPAYRARTDAGTIRITE